MRQDAFIDSLLNGKYTARYSRQRVNNVFAPEMVNCTGCLENAAATEKQIFFCESGRSKRFGNLTGVLLKIHACTLRRAANGKNRSFDPLTPSRRAVRAFQGYSPHQFSALKNISRERHYVSRFAANAPRYIFRI